MGVLWLQYPPQLLAVEASTICAAEFSLGVELVGEQNTPSSRKFQWKGDMFSNHFSFFRDLLFQEKQGDYGNDGSGWAIWTLWKEISDSKNLKVSPWLGVAFKQGWWANFCLLPLWHIARQSLWRNFGGDCITENPILKPTVRMWQFSPSDLIAILFSRNCSFLLRAIKHNPINCWMKNRSS